MDVLHYLDYPSQETHPPRPRGARPPVACCMMRIGDAAGGLGFTLSKVTDQTVALCRSGALDEAALPHARAVAGAARAAPVRARARVPMSEGTPFPNTLILAHAQ